MAYNQRNYLLTVKQVQDTYLAHKQEGISTMYVFRKFIEPAFHISRSTFYNYLDIPANKLLKELDEKRAAKRQKRAQEEQAKSV